MFGGLENVSVEKAGQGIPEEEEQVKRTRADVRPNKALGLTKAQDERKGTEVLAEGHVTLLQCVLVSNKPLQFVMASSSNVFSPMQHKFLGVIQLYLVPPGPLRWPLRVLWGIQWKLNYGRQRPFSSWWASPRVCMAPSFQTEAPKREGVAAARPINGHPWNHHGITLPCIFYGSERSQTQPGAKWEREGNCTKVQIPVDMLHHGGRSPKSRYQQ